MCSWPCCTAPCNSFHDGVCRLPRFSGWAVSASPPSPPRRQVFDLLPAESRTAWVLLGAFLTVGVAAALLDLRAIAGKVVGGVALVFLVLGLMASNSCRLPGTPRLAFDRVQGALPEEELGPAGARQVRDRLPAPTESRPLITW